MIKIEKGVPVPPAQNGRPVTYPFGEMNIGDSFFVADVGKRFSIYSQVRYYNEKNGRTIQVVQRRESNGVRVWRIA